MRAAFGWIYDFDLTTSEGVAAMWAELCRYRKSIGMTQREVSEYMGTPSSVISRLERGKVTNPTILTVMTYMHALGLDSQFRLYTADGEEVTLARSSDKLHIQTTERGQE
jgi:transcriptional regulator with XRE-family HTH domain